MQKLINQFQDLALRAFVSVKTGTRPTSAQGALEYIAIAVGLIIIIYAGFRILGGDISDMASTLVCRVSGGTNCTP